MFHANENIHLPPLPTISPAVRVVKGLWTIDLLDPEMRTCCVFYRGLSRWALTGQGNDHRSRPAALGVTLSGVLDRGGGLAFAHVGDGGSGRGWAGHVCTVDMGVSALFASRFPVSKS
ncbi:hypothetical protein LZ31DRAFT_380000 [Colletotrichum somersetense]|nr:hypothetical protein LZ31DRAFT_380000 [Colletotrichum somersetense]